MIPVRRPHWAIYWPPTGADEFGRQTFGPPVELQCRWDDTMQTVVASDGVETLSSSTVIFKNDDVETGGILKRGRLADVTDPAKRYPLTDPRTGPGAREIISKTSNANLYGTYSVNQAHLK